jgi:hypothetical protein
MTITPQQCHAARILAQIGLGLLAAESGLSLDAIASFESGLAASDRQTASALQRALERLGIEFVPEEGGRGAGVRLKFDRAGTRQLSGWESEGGQPADNDVP